MSLWRRAMTSPEAASSTESPIASTSGRRGTVVLVEERRAGEAGTATADLAATVVAGPVPEEPEAPRLELDALPAVRAPGGALGDELDALGWLVVSPLLGAAPPVVDGAAVEPPGPVAAPALDELVEEAAP